MTTPFELQDFDVLPKRLFHNWLEEYENIINKLTQILNEENKHLIQFDSLKSLYEKEPEIRSQKLEIFNHFEILCEEFIQSPHWKKEFPKYYERWKILHDHFSKTLQESAFHLDVAETLNIQMLELFSKASQSLQPHNYNNKGSRKAIYSSSSLSTFHQSI